MTHVHHEHPRIYNVLCTRTTQRGDWQQKIALYLPTKSWRKLSLSASLWRVWLNWYVMYTRLHLTPANCNNTCNTYTRTANNTKVHHQLWQLVTIKSRPQSIWQSSSKWYGDFWHGAWQLSLKTGQNSVLNFGEESAASNLGLAYDVGGRHALMQVQSMYEKSCLWYDVM